MNRATHVFSLNIAYAVNISTQVSVGSRHLTCPRLLPPERSAPARLQLFTKASKQPTAHTTIISTSNSINRTPTPHITHHTHRTRTQYRHESHNKHTQTRKRSRCRESSTSRKPTASSSASPIKTSPRPTPRPKSQSPHPRARAKQAPRATPPPRRPPRRPMAWRSRPLEVADVQRRETRLRLTERRLRQQRQPPK